MSRDEDPRLLELADRIGKRAVIDWQREFLRSSDAQELRLLQSLETLGRIRALHAESPGGAARTWGRLELKQEIGRGSFGQVWRAHDPDLQRDVALKLLDPARTASTQERAKVLREARCLARVRHENVVTVHGVEEHEGRVGLWMELVSGKNLSHLLQENGPYSEGELQQAALVLTRALAALHREGVLHRDIKPQNIVREAGGRLVLMDLGAGSRAEDDAHEMIGTPLYLAPELLAGKPASVATDIYALGVTLFHLASGRFPLEADSVDALHAAHAGAPAARRRLADLRPDYTPEFVACIERCLAPQAGRRWQSAGALLQALTANGPARPSKSRRRLALVSVAVVALASLIAFGSRELFWRRASFEVEAAVFRWTLDGREDLDAGARLGPNDAIGLRLRGDRELHVYVLNEDDLGRTRLLFPLPWLETQNPLLAQREYRLPGRVDGAEQAWAMSEQAARERLVVVASPRVVPELEDWIRRLPKAESAAGEPLLEGATLEGTRRRLRGLGRVVAVSEQSGGAGFGALGELDELLAGPQSARGVWVRRFEYRTTP